MKDTSIRFISCFAAAAVVVGVLIFQNVSISAKYENLKYGGEFEALGTLAECAGDMISGGGELAAVCERAKNSADVLGLNCVRRFAEKFEELGYSAASYDTENEAAINGAVADNETLRSMALECADKLRRQCLVALDSAERGDAVAAIPLIFEQFDSYLALSEESEGGYATLANLSEINEREAKELAYGIFDRALSLRVSKSEGAQPLWICSCDSAYAAFTCLGGRLMSMSASRAGGESVVGEEEAMEHMLNFIIGQGMVDAKTDKIIISENRIDAVYSCGNVENAVSCSISLSDGKICDYNAENYYRYAK